MTAAAIENVTYIQLKLCRTMGRLQSLGLTQKEAHEHISEQLEALHKVQVSPAWVGAFLRNSPKEAARSSYHRVIAMEDFVKNQGDGA
jgi:hypothetical protein